MVNTNYNSTEDMINKLQELKGKTKLNFYKIIGNYYDNLNVRMDEDTFAKNAQSISKIHHEVLSLRKYLQTKLQVKNMNINYYDLYYTVNKNRTEKYKEEEQEEIVDNQYENDFIYFNDIVPNHYTGRKNDKEISR